MTKYRLPVLFCVLLLIPWMVSCSGGKTKNVDYVYTGGNSQMGKQLVVKFRCGACHVIPGISGANGTVGPPLTAIGRRTMIAGLLPNTPSNMEDWLEDPPAIQPKTAMPDLGITKKQARNITAFLYTLQ